MFKFSFNDNSYCGFIKIMEEIICNPYNDSRHSNKKIKLNLRMVNFMTVKFGIKENKSKLYQI